MRQKALAPLLLLLLVPAVALAHGGNPDVFYEGQAGPYRLFVTVRTPQVVPGVAEVRVRAASADVQAVHVTAMPLTGPGARFGPAPEAAERSRQDPQAFSGTLWLMTKGAWQVRVSASGPRGTHALAVPVRALPTQTAPMDPTLALVLAAGMVLLALGAVVLVQSAVAQATLPPGLPVSRTQRRAGRVGAFAAVAGVLAVLAFGRAWWRAEERGYQRHLYRPLTLAAAAEGDRLALTLGDPGWIASRRLDDLVPDHDHLMHLFVVRLPELERVWHLHPEQVAPGRFTQALPPELPRGRYALFAEVVHATGLSETLRAEVELPAHDGRPLQGDDSAGRSPRLSDATLEATRFSFEDGTRLMWARPSAPLRADAPGTLRFRLFDAEGFPTPLEPYMGMLGHAAVVRWDLSRFAHVHPSGTSPMAAVALAEASLRGPEGAQATLAHAAVPADAAQPPPAPDRPRPLAVPASARLADPHGAVTGSMPNEVSFPYAFPEPGRYRLFVQVKHAGAVRTASFDVSVLPALPGDAARLPALPAGEHDAAAPPSGAHPSGE